MGPLFIWGRSRGEPLSLSFWTPGDIKTHQVNVGRENHRDKQKDTSVHPKAGQSSHSTVTPEPHASQVFWRAFGQSYGYSLKFSQFTHQVWEEPSSVTACWDASISHTHNVPQDFFSRHSSRDRRKVKSPSAHFSPANKVALQTLAADNLSIRKLSE